MPTNLPLPLYTCIRKVCAFRIKSIQPDTRRGMLLVPDHPTLPALWVTDDWVRLQAPEGDKHDEAHTVIKRGGYYVVDARGYATYMDAAAFESEHEFVSDAPAPTPTTEDAMAAMRRELDELKAVLLQKAIIEERTPIPGHNWDA